MNDTNIYRLPALDRISVSHILSPCPLAAVGLAGLAGGTICQLPFLDPAEEIAKIQAGMSNGRMIVIFIPDDLYWLLVTLRQMAALFNTAAFPLPVLLLGHCSASWLWQTLQKLVTHPERLAAVWSTSANLPCSQLAKLLRGGLRMYPRLEIQARKEEQTWGRRSGGVTPRELDAVLGMFHSTNIRRQAQVRNLSIKTLYCQRRTGLKKMAEQIPPIAMPFSGIKQRRTGADQDLPLSAFEAEFVHAIHSGQVFPVFQPVVDGNMCLQGFEILSRWFREGKILSPGEFFPNIHSRYAWLLLTDFVLQVAVHQINKRQNNGYFSVNIPPVVMEHDYLELMLSTARRRLIHPQQVNLLALEIAETAVLTRGKTAATILELKKQGFRIMLDDCFSPGSVMFPVRTVRFNDYKLDLSVVKDIQDDEHACVLIKSLVYYCGLTGSHCTAEGVDDMNKYKLLKELGVEYFQGYMISPPVTEVKIGDFIMQRPVF